MKGRCRSEWLTWSRRLFSPQGGEGLTVVNGISCARTRTGAVPCCGEPPGGKQFRCRQGWGRRVAYSSQFLNSVDRAHRGQAKIKARLLADCDLELWELPPKPKWMRWSTYDRYAEKFYRYEEILGEGVDELLAKLAEE